jgi:hypothetical protein
MCTHSSSSSIVMTLEDCPESGNAAAVIDLACFASSLICFVYFFFTEKKLIIDFCFNFLIFGSFASASITATLSLCMFDNSHTTSASAGVPTSRGSVLNDSIMCLGYTNPLRL